MILNLSFFSLIFSVCHVLYCALTTFMDVFQSYFLFGIWRLKSQEILAFLSKRFQTMLIQIGLVVKVFTSQASGLGFDSMSNYKMEAQVVIATAFLFIQCVGMHCTSSIQLPCQICLCFTLFPFSVWQRNCFPCETNL